ncbi:DMT family transporter [Neptunicoccus sediminis]|uniref:DMT family transporter n=1 Tax=Neptunicoccus sediminis TaxID=1892596 RepID=UPI000845E6CF|nr:DMT family transporter [Neptunicoccus sediminis]
MTRTSYLPVWLAFICALFWGLWWLPVRALESSGLDGAWAGTAMNAGALPVLLLLFFARRANRRIDLRVMASGALIGGAMMLYSAAITETTVVRAVLLFYLAPAWAIAIEWMFMGRRLRWINGLALLLAAGGVTLIFRGQISLSHWNAGDLLALLSGMCWAVGSALIFTGPDIGARTLGLFGCTGGMVIGAILAFGTGHSLPTPADPLEPMLLALASGMLYIAPVLVVTLWSARRLNPTLLSFLLTGEIISGISTSAFFLSEPFGWPELAGSALVICAALTEVLRPAPKPAAA